MMGVNNMNRAEYKAFVVHKVDQKVEYVIFNGVQQMKYGFFEGGI